MDAAEVTGREQGRYGDGLDLCEVVAYGIALFGGGFTGTPNLGIGLSDTSRW